SRLTAIPRGLTCHSPMGMPNAGSGAFRKSGAPNGPEARPSRRRNCPIIAGCRRPITHRGKGQTELVEPHRLFLKHFTCQCPVRSCILLVFVAPESDERELLLLLLWPRDVKP